MSFVIALKFKFTSSERSIEGKELTEEEKRINCAGKLVKLRISRGRKTNKQKKSSKLYKLHLICNSKRMEKKIPKPKNLLTFGEKIRTFLQKEYTIL